MSDENLSAYISQIFLDEVSDEELDLLLKKFKESPSLQKELGNQIFMDAALKSELGDVHPSRELVEKVLKQIDALEVQKQRIAEVPKQPATYPFIKTKAIRFRLRPLYWVPAAIASAIILVLLVVPKNPVVRIEGSYKLVEKKFITTQARSATIYLRDRSKIRMAPNTHLKALGKVGDIRQVVYLKGGEITVQVPKERDKQFQVKTQVGKVTTLSTEFRIKLVKNERGGEMITKVKKAAMILTVAVMVGKVNVEYDGKNYELSAGMKQVFGEEVKGAFGVIPTPRIEEYGKGNVSLSKEGEAVSIAFSNLVLNESEPAKQGFHLLNKRIELLKGQELKVQENSRGAKIVVERCLPADLAKAFKSLGIKQDVKGKQLEQGYVLESKEGRVFIKACSDLGVYYGIVSLVQLIDKAPEGGINIPLVKIVDWPEIGLRLGKLSASRYKIWGWKKNYPVVWSELYPNAPNTRQIRATVQTVQKAARWMPVYKFNMLGLQFHSGHSRRPPKTFNDIVKTICSEERKNGILETVVYFCPFRHNKWAREDKDFRGAYDFNNPEECKQYVEYLIWILDQGAHGIELDYNDWPYRGGKLIPIEGVINLVCKGIEEKHPDAYVLYCPPNKKHVKGFGSYMGPADADMKRILSRVPEKVWPMWVGTWWSTAGFGERQESQLTRPLTTEQAETWNRDAGRKSFLWLNGVDLPGALLSKKVEEASGWFAFTGDEVLPKPEDLNQVFEGIHLNVVGPLAIWKPTMGGSQVLAYYATVADYLWNPQDYDAKRSCKRAQRFVEIMLPLVVPEEERTANK